ncbi:MAG: prepilin peptidase [Gemmatimonadaceae bacterium]
MTGGSVFAGSTAALGAGALFTALLVVACVSDLRARRLPNALNLLLAVTGASFSAAVLPFGEAMARAGIGMLVGFAIWLPFWFLRFLGAGDVKLAAAAGAWLGASGSLRAALISLVVGGVLAFVALLWQRKLRDAMISTTVWTAAAQAGRLEAPSPLVRTRYQLPYGVALATGAALAAWFPHLLG